MLATALALAATQNGALTRAQALAVGLSPATLYRLAHVGGWENPVRGGFVVPAAPDRVHARARAAQLIRPDAVVCAVTAARIHRFPGLPQPTHDEPIHLLLPSTARTSRSRGVVLRWSPLTSAESMTVAGIRITHPSRTIADLILWSSREEAVCLLDALLHEYRLDEENLAAIKIAVAGRHGGRRADTFWDLVDRRSESPLETRLRLLLVDAGLSPEQLQWPVRNEVTGVPVARLDLAWPSRLLDVEADGAATHNGTTALYRDRYRQNDLVGRGWTVLRFTWPDVVHRPEYVIESVRRQLDR